MNLDSIFRLDVSLFEIILRGSVVYLGIFFFLRITLRRESGTVNTSDLLLMVLIADAVQNAMAPKYESVTSGLLLVATLVFWNITLDFLSFRWQWLDTLIQPRPLPLILNGRLIHKNLRKEFLKDEDLASLLRQQGVEKPSEVRKAFMESNGRLSVIKYNDNEHSNKNGRTGGIAGD